MHQGVEELGLIWVSEAMALWEGLCQFWMAGVAAETLVYDRAEGVCYLQLVGDKRFGLSVLEIREHGKSLASGVVEQLASSEHFGGGGLALWHRPHQQTG